MADPVPALGLEDVRLAYGGLVALAGVSISVPEGSVTGLIGPNGAGKTSLFDVVTGLARPAGGSVRLRDEDVTRFRPARRARLGLARTFQRIELYASLSVWENVAVGAEAMSRARFRPGRWHLLESDAEQFTEEALARVGLSDLAAARVDTLPTGTARLVEVARALAGRPRVLLLDEPASGLDRRETDQLGRLVNELAGEGLAILLVEHDVELVMRLCSEVYVLDRGSVIARGAPAEVQTDEAVRDAYLGQLALT